MDIWIYGFLKNSQKPPKKWSLVETKSTLLELPLPKPSTGNLQSPGLNNKENHFFAWIALMYPTYFFFSPLLPGHWNIQELF
jgi:hypothetical protein